MNIMNEIKTLAVEYRDITGIEATRVYLGRKELRRLSEWLYNQGYWKNIKVDGEGVDRPEVWGMKVYVVNDDEQHMRCCA